MKAWVSKYALSAGIAEVDGEVFTSPTGDTDFLSLRVIRLGGGPIDFYHREGRDWHRTREDAATRAEKMRLDKIESLKKQIRKLQRLSFFRLEKP